MKLARAKEGLLELLVLQAQGRTLNAGDLKNIKNHILTRQLRISDPPASNDFPRSHSWQVAELQLRHRGPEP